MRFVVANTHVPFVRGGAELLAEWLCEKLIEYGHQADVIRLPFRWNPADHILDHVLAIRLLSLANVDRVIALKFPAYCIRHESKIVWLLHQFRQAYDLWGTPYQDIPSTPEGFAIRDAIVNTDTACLGEATRIYTNSKVTADRLKRYNGIDSSVLHPPLRDTTGYRCEAFGNYVFCPSRISDLKRQYLLIESMQHVRSDVRLVLAGNPDDAASLHRVSEAIREHGVGDRVELISRWISDDEKKALFANALACAYIPYDEDSYGYVTLESLQSSKPVITCSDSGGALELVEHGVTGLVVPPDPRNLAEAIEELGSDRRRAVELGRVGFERLGSMKISWDTVVEALTR
jgi:glycosyltransferase involved in cell wall biosynthesis